MTAMMWKCHLQSLKPPPTFPTLQNRCFSCSCSPLLASYQNHYQVLGLEKGAPISRIKAQYYAMSKQFHPDHNRNASSQTQLETKKKFQRIKEAYETLIDPFQRTSYDLSLRHHHATNSHGEYTNSSSQASDSSFHPTSSAGYRNARTSDYYGSPQYRGNRSAASSFHRKPKPDHASSHSTFSHDPHSPQHKTPHSSNEPLRPRHRTGSNYDVPHFDFDKHYRQQRSYEHHRNQMNIKQGRIVRQPGMVYPKSPEERPPIFTISFPSILAMLCGFGALMYSFILTMR